MRICVCDLDLKVMVFAKAFLVGGVEGSLLAQVGLLELVHIRDWQQMQRYGRRILALGSKPGLFCGEKLSTCATV